ncbi:hypothetical protein ACFL02_08255 [Planctomycetota bacterium]
MRSVSLKKILIAFGIIFLLSRSRKIIDFFSEHGGEGFFDFLTLEPLHQSSIEAKYIVTLALFALVFITVFRLLYKRK